MSQPPNDPSPPAGPSGDQPTYGQPSSGSSYGQPPAAPPAGPQYPGSQYPDQHQHQQQYGQQPGWTQPSPAQYGTDIRQTEAGYAQMYGQKPRTGMSVAAMVLGILGLLASPWPIASYVAVILAVLAVVFGIVGVRRQAGKGMAIAGIVLGGIALVVSIIASIFWTRVGAEAIDIINECTAETGTSSGPAFDLCVTERSERFDPFN